MIETISGNIHRIIPTSIGTASEKHARIAAKKCQKKESMS